MTVKQVKSDLEEIKFYYENQAEFELAAKSIGESSIAAKVKKYNETVTRASALLYSLYVALYVNGSTQQDYALDTNRSINHICRLNLQLCKFFISQFDVK